MVTKLQVMKPTLRPHSIGDHLECWSLLQLSAAELAPREGTKEDGHLKECCLIGRSFTAASCLPDSWSKLQHSKSTVPASCIKPVFFS
ncbi:hypothetical protein DES53_11025 [Roseimicrobium gellanilyticum]|uniref:Uncharacterized protein n=1 Tax=Roseimicrobium gellanilyticum TaxID=748857 RepID=A0A366H9R0_9BACT|nr:hypothetical protein DES53_11025 [Roseimicrobium gellanilyticum]